MQLPSEVVLLLFLPALLYWESLTTSLREIRSNLRVIVLLSTALVIYALAVGITRGAEHLSAPSVLGLFLFAYGGGAVAGVIVVWLSIRVYRALDDPMLGTVTSMVTPFAAFGLAQAVHASGVLAVVVAGLIISQQGPRAGCPDTRQEIQAFWAVSTFVLNCALFVLVGLELQSAVRGLASSGRGGTGLTHGLIAVGAVPVAVSSGRLFPDRDLVIFVTSGVIVVTLVVQGLLLPVVVRWARLGQDGSVQTERHLAETIATEEALEAIPQIAAGLATDPEIAARLQREYTKHLRLLHANDGDAADEPALHYDRQYTALRQAVLARERAVVLRLRDEGRIDDTVLRQVQSRLDIEEVRLSRREQTE